MMEIAQRSVLTIATGNPVYMALAANLARSFKLWHKNSQIHFTLVTDQKHLLPPDLRDIDLVEIEPGQYGKGFSTKLHLDRFAPAQQTLFIDSDSLCVGPLDGVFDQFAGKSVSVIGRNISEGEWFGDVNATCSHFNLPSIPCFVGGIYYLEKGHISSSVYAAARELESQYDQLGLVRLRNLPNEEPLMAISMAMHRQLPLRDNGDIKAEPMFYPSKVDVDVFRGRAILLNNSEDPNHNSPWRLRESQPLIVHFHSSNAERNPYTREAIKLERVMAKGWPLSLARGYAAITCTAPQSFLNTSKAILRPIYRKFFGPRSIRKSVRIA